jgi:HAD superfamily phosphatase (TIGR01668 family)
MFSWNGLAEACRPRAVVKDIREIDFRALKARGITALLFDIDDTLLPRAVNDIYPDLFERIAALKQEGFRICLTSNSRHPLRVKYIGDTLGVPAISFGFKPLPFAFRRSLEILRAKPEETAMIGDQLFMDILGANLVGLYSILVWHHIPESFPPRIWMRQAEDWVLAKLGFSAPL